MHSIGELVKDGINGKIFQNEQELAKQIIVSPQEREERERLCS